MTQRLTAGTFFGQARGRLEVSGLTFAESSYSAASDIPTHVHDHAFFYLVIEGACEETCGRRTSTCGPSTLVFHPAGAPHANRWPGAGGRAFHLEISQNRADTIREHSPILEERGEFRSGVVPWLAMRLYREFRRQDGASLLALEGMALEVIAEASRRESADRRRMAPRWLDRACELLRDRLTERLSLDTIAAAVAVHPVHLARAFRREHGCSVGEYLRRLRVEAACHSLSTTDMPLADIALASGFSDQSHFTKTFRQYGGMTPGEYRRRMRVR